MGGVSTSLFRALPSTGSTSLIDHNTRTRMYAGAHTHTHTSIRELDRTLTGYAYAPELFWKLERLDAGSTSHEQQQQDQTLETESLRVSAGRTCDMDRGVRAPPGRIARSHNVADGVHVVQRLGRRWQARAHALLFLSDVLPHTAAHRVARAQTHTTHSCTQHAAHDHTHAHLHQVFCRADDGSSGRIDADRTHHRGSVGLQLLMMLRVCRWRSAHLPRPRRPRAMGGRSAAGRPQRPVVPRDKPLGCASCLPPGPSRADKWVAPV